MTTPISVDLKTTDINAIATARGRVVVFVGADKKLDTAARRVNRLCKGALVRSVDGDGFDKMAQGVGADLAFPAGMAADAVQVIKLDARGGPADARKAGASIAAARDGKLLLVLAARLKHGHDVMKGLMLRDYRFSDHLSQDTAPETATTMMVAKPDEFAARAAEIAALAQGIFFTRDLVNEPANILTTSEFANRLSDLQDIGLEVEVLDEAKLESLGMRALLGVGQGSDSPSKVVILKWTGGDVDQPPLALVGKGVVFDTGGISIKPAGGMETMTMDMGGAGVVAGVMKTLALRQARANVVGIVGLVENMPDGRAQRPGDVVRSMKGDTIEVINTDAEGRLVLCDIMWYAQERFAPVAMIDLATLTGGIITALGNHNGGVFSNDDTVCDAFLTAATQEGEAAWRMPLDAAYDKLLKSSIADVKNVGGPKASSITAAKFLQRFVKDDTPWIHLDIAGVASVAQGTTLAPKGATGWGVLALNRLISHKYED